MISTRKIIISILLCFQAIPTVRCQNSPQNGSNNNFPFVSANYFLYPSAIPLEKGEIHYRNSLGTMNTFHVGLAQNFTLTTGLDLISSVVGYPFFYLNPKFGGHIGNGVHVGIGAFFQASYEYRTTLYGELTWGNKRSNISLILGARYAEGSFYENLQYMINTKIGLGKRAFFVLETRLNPCADYIDIFQVQTISGFQYLWSKVSLDTGIMVMRRNYACDAFALPYLGFTVPILKH